MSLNLNKLESALDEALAKETPESLTAFMNERRESANTFIKPSRIHGLGLFALIPIAAGTKIVHGEADFDAHRDEWIQYTKTQKQVSFAYTQGYCMVNHSKTPNTKRNEDMDFVAAVDIPSGAEITEDYNALPDDYNPFLNTLEELIFRAKRT